VQQFFDYANQERLMPLLLMAEGLPETIESRKSSYRSLLAFYRKRYDLQCAAMPRFTRIAGEDGCLFYKGFDFCHRIYAHPELRPMTDIDVLVPKNEFDRFLARFRQEGIEQTWGRHGASFSPDYHEASILLGEVHVEIHRSLSQHVRAVIDYEGLWSRRERFEANGISGQRLSGPDALLCQAYELAKDEFASPLIRYVDFYHLVQGQIGALSLCVERARAWRIERALFGAISLTARLFPSLQHAQVSDAVNELLTASQRAFLTRYVLPDPAREPSGHAKGRLEQVRRKLFLIDSPWRRLRLLGFAMHQEFRGSLREWRLRRAGAEIPPRWGRRARRPG
jgi:hypothetical protein